MEDFLTGLISNIVASVPAVLVIVYGVMNSAKILKKSTLTFPDAISDTKDVLHTQFTAQKNQMIASYEQMRREIRQTVLDTTKEFKGSVNDTMVAMQKELAQYKNMIVSLRDQTHLLILENKEFAEMMMILVSKDAQLVRDGVSSFVSGKLHDLLAEADKHRQNFIDGLPTFESLFKELLLAIGQDEFDKLLERIDYERKTQELPFTEQSI